MELTSKNKHSEWQRFLPWIGLACIMTAFVISVIRLHPRNLFGQSEDDSIYFSSAKGLAEGKGYVLASFPGTPPATKYPEFYPWVLSWVWRWNPSFPENLTDAIAVSVAFGLLYITTCFLFLSRFNGISDTEALVLTTFCALNPVVIFYSGRVLSEIPFAALALTAILLAERAVQPTALPPVVIFCGILVGISISTRAFGVPIAVGLLAAALVHRAWRQLLIFAGSVAPFLAALGWKTISARKMAPPVSRRAASSLGWVHTWTYYTSYINVWKQGVPTLAIFFSMLKYNVLTLVITPGSYFLNPLVQPKTIPATAISDLISRSGHTRQAFYVSCRMIDLGPFTSYCLFMWA